MSGHLDSRELVIDVSNLMRNSFRRERVRAELLLELGEEGLSESHDGRPVLVDLWLESSSDGIRAHGAIDGLLPLECTRCTEPIDFHLLAKVDEFFFNADLKAITPDGEEVEMPEDEGYRLEGDELDLNPMVNDQVLLSLPIKHLCREDCRGLCSFCGSNLNLASCDCHEEALDPRLQKLQQWLDREGEM